MSVLQHHSQMSLMLLVTLVKPVLLPIALFLLLPNVAGLPPAGARIPGFLWLVVDDNGEEKEIKMINKWLIENSQLYKLFRRRYFGWSLPCPWEERDRKWGPNKVDKYFSTFCFEIFRFHIWLIGINRIMDPLIIIRQEYYLGAFDPV